MTSLPTLSNTELTLWVDYIYELSNIQLDMTKGYLIETRLTPLLRELDAQSWKQFLDKVKNSSDGLLKVKVINAITTNETSFFRDTAPFEMLQNKLIPELVETRKKQNIQPIPIRILSAACSTGQEIYSIAITLKETLKNLKGFDIKLVGLDISKAALERAAEGVYSQLEIERGLDRKKIDAHFTKFHDNWKINDELRNLTTFKQMNLLDPIPATAPFDIIFCRNIAIYFNPSDKLKLFKNLAKSLAPDGAFIIGSTETITEICPNLKIERYLRSVCYKRAK